MATSTNATKGTKGTKSTKSSIITTAEGLDLTQWADALKGAAGEYKSAAARVLQLVIDGRAFALDEKTARPIVRAAFGDMQGRSTAKRVADAMAILKAPAAAIPAASKAPKNLQHYAEAVRAHSAYKAKYPSRGQGSKGSKEKAPTSNANVKKIDTAPPSDDVKPLDVAGIREALRGTLNGFKKRAADEAALSLVSELLDVLGE